MLLRILLCFCVINGYSQVISNTKPRTDFEIADSLEKIKEFDRALFFYSRSINLKEDTVDAYYRRGTLNIELKNYRAAIEDLSHYVESIKGTEYTRDTTLGPKRKGFTIDQAMISYYMMGVCYLGFDEIDKGCRCLTKAAEFGMRDANELIQKRCNK